jgi:hypothetical protein
LALVAEAVAAVAEAVAAVLLVLLQFLLLQVLLQVAVDLAHPAHKLLPLLLQVAAARPVPLPQQPEVAAAAVSVQGLVASESLRPR